MPDAAMQETARDVGSLMAAFEVGVPPHELLAEIVTDPTRAARALVLLCSMASALAEGCDLAMDRPAGTKALTDFLDRMETGA